MWNIYKTGEKNAKTASRLKKLIRNNDFTRRTSKKNPTDYSRGKEPRRSSELAVSAARVPGLGCVCAALLGELQSAEGDPHPLHGPLAPAEDCVLHMLPEVL